MPRVNVEQKAFTDPRFSHLGRLLGTTRHDAIGRMALVWSVCTEQNRYVLTREVLNHLFEDTERFSDLILKAKLGRRRRQGIYICGSRGRIEWLERKRRACRENGKKGGRPRKTEQKPKKNQRRFPAETAPAPAPVPALALVPAQGMVPSSPSPSARDDDGVAIVQRTIGAVAPQMPQPDGATVARWLEAIGEEDPYYIAACLLESAPHLTRARSPNYIEALLRNRRQERWCCPDARGYVEYQLGKVDRGSGLGLGTPPPTMADGDT